MIRPLVSFVSSAVVFALLAGAGAAPASPGDPRPEGYVATAGSCRGESWNERGWPRGEGLRTPAECRVLCDETDGCTSFDLARPQGARYECTLFGHLDVVGMENAGDTCFTLEPAEVSQDLPAYVPQAGFCRNADRRGGLKAGRVVAMTLNEAHERCRATPGCTGFELGKPRAGRFEARVFTKRAVVGAGGERGQCFAVVVQDRDHDRDRDRDRERDRDRDRDERARRNPPPLPPFDPRAVVRVEGPVCPGGYVLVTYGEADAHREAVCARLQRWDVAWLAGGASMDGPGYDCKLRGREERKLGNALCRPDGTDRR